MVGPRNVPDTVADGTSDHLDPDDDGDGIETRIEGGTDFDDGPCATTPTESSDTGCGCDGTGSPPWLGLLLLPLVVRIRARAER